MSSRNSGHENLRIILFLDVTLYTNTDGGESGTESKIVGKIRAPLFAENSEQFALKDVVLTLIILPITRTIIIVRMHSPLPDNNRANVCLRYVSSNATNPRSFVIVIRDLVHEDYLQFKVMIKKDSMRLLLRLTYTGLLFSV